MIFLIKAHELKLHTNQQQNEHQTWTIDLRLDLIYVYLVSGALVS